MSDLISREDAINALRKAENHAFNNFYRGLVKAHKIIANLPSAEPERKHGEWLPHPHEREWDVCSVCGIGCKRREYEMQFGQEKFSEYSYQYCPNCGARLEQE